MVGRLDSALAKEYQGNILFYRYLHSARNPSFLNRNLARALQLHQQESEQDSAPEKAPTFPLQGWEHMNRPFWRIPSSDHLTNMSQQRNDQSFVLEMKEIKPVNSDSHLWSAPAKKKGPLFRFDVQIHVTILEAASGKECTNTQNIKATLLGIHHEEEKSVSIDAAKVLVKLEDLMVVLGQRGKSIGNAYSLMLSLNFKGSEDAEVFYSCMSPNDVNLQQDSPTRLSVTWGNIMQCPATDTVLPFKMSGPTKTPRNICLGLQVRMAWERTSTPGESVLAASNRELYSSLSSRAYPTPPLDTEASHKTNFEITYVYKNETFVRLGLACPNCGRDNFADIDDLRMHLEVWHEFFKYRVQKVSIKETEDIECWQFDCETAEHRSDRRASDRAPDPRDIAMIAPSIPFNRQKYLDEGNEDFRQLANLEKVARPLVRQKSSLVVERVRPKPKPPNIVKERVLESKKTFRIPKAPRGVTFFRNQTKRPLVEGEYVSESDEEANLEWEWLQLRKDAYNDSDPAIPILRKQFLTEFDRFVRDEGLQSDIHMGDALVRFTRSRSAWLWQADTVDEFACKLEELVHGKIVSQDILYACMRMVNEHKPSTRDSEENGDVRIQDAAGVIGSSSPPPNICLCGQDALASTSKRQIICCKDNDCIRYSFHVDCIMNYWKPAERPDPRSSWVCKDCE